MAEPTYSNLNPLPQSPVQAIDPLEPDPNFDDQRSDPLLDFSTSIDVGRNGDIDASIQMNQDPRSDVAAGETTPTTAEAAGAADVTPLTQRRPRRLPEEMMEKPSWLPEDWKLEVKVRSTGATAGVADRYFIAPSGQKFRSKIEVLHFLETGSRRKKKLKSDAGATPSESPSDRGQKKSKANIRNFTNMNFDFRSPPQSVTWVQSDDSKDEWMPSVGNTMLPKSSKYEWENVFSRVAQLERSNGAS